MRRSARGLPAADATALGQSSGIQASWLHRRICSRHLFIHLRSEDLRGPSRLLYRKQAGLLNGWQSRLRSTDTQVLQCLVYMGGQSPRWLAALAQKYGSPHWLRRTHTRDKATASDWRIFGLLQRPSFDRKTVSRPVVIAGSEVQNSTHHWPYMYTRPPPNGAAQNRTRLAA